MNIPIPLKSTIYSILFLTLTSLFLTGCESLPPGTPPEGAIVSITTTSSDTLSPKNAINDMTTAVATCPQLYKSSEISSVGLLPTRILEKKYEVQLRSLTAHLYRNLNEMDMIKPPSFSKTPDYLLASKFLEISSFEENNDETAFAVFRWEVWLVSPLTPSKTLWKQGVSVKIKEASKKY